MMLNFAKMHGLGNDFVVIDAITQHVALTREHVRFLADRHFGVGCDQLLLVEASTQAGVDFRYRIFNADGGEVEQCGNGARCFAKFVRDKKLTQLDVIRVETNSGLIVLHVESDGQVTVDMGLPRFDPHEIPFEAPVWEPEYALVVNGESMLVGAVSVGNPHAVLCVADVDSAPVAQLGPLIESHGSFPRRVNVGFMQIVSADHVRLRVYERGVGETLACGTGACAAVVVGRMWGELLEEVKVDLPGGQLLIHWAGPGHSVRMTGPAVTVFEGVVALPTA